MQILTSLFPVSNTTTMKAKVREVTINKVDFQKLREKQGLTFADLAKLSGIDRGHLGQYERGNLTMSEETWAKVKKVLDLSKKDLANKLKEI